MDSIILSSPFALLLYGLAIFLCLFDRRYHASRGIFTVLSTVIVLITTVYVLTLGCSLAECLVVFLVFLLLNMESGYEL